MKGLILKDMINLRKYSRTVFLMIVFFTMFSFMSDDFTLGSGIIVIMCSMMAITSFSFDKQSHWDTYAISLPIPRSRIVMSKYVLALLTALFGVLLSVVAGTVFNLIHGTTNGSDLFILAYALFVVAVTYQSIILPLIYKFGVEKSRVFMFVVFGLPSLLVIGLNSVGISMPDEEAIMQLIRLSPIILIVFIIVSYAISNAVYKRKEL